MSIREQYMKDWVDYQKDCIDILLWEHLTKDTDQINQATTASGRTSDAKL